MKTKLLALLLAVTVFMMPTASFADIIEGESIVTLGENLSEQQKQDLLKEMKTPKDATIITVSNAEEHKFLEGIVPKAQIGTRAISSSMITYTKPGSGLIVRSKNINWVTDAMYTNALITAGVKDAEIQITAPFKVSGTAALTGLMKAYETASNKQIPEEVKKVANEEMVQTAQLGDKIGEEKAVQLVAKIKEEIAKEQPKTTEDLRSLIKKIADQLGITLTDEQLDNLVSLFDKMKNLNIDWNQVGSQLNKAKEHVSAFLGSEEGQSFLDKVKDFFSSIIDFVKSLFK
ncbi:TPA: DUF1002 domain-containing protein [Bacillus thuringiensis]|uniref:DUF1002 domain-containing protein n=2 Tax=Bacillus cereus group TaxID=86661 RepID=A0A9X6Q2N1_BACTU|nr:MULTISPECIES: DUF1002 domain-containing protein [Bacillus cereus group]AGE79939.1 hypothetical protein HD73_4361 [Bacillus thuringiensis serovar kurstaki str. HD73]AHZ52917.1 hypothetical protein YBT1520_21620 [Bacillus thuringiensis serovar kurstaki str. YBT-1520]AIE35342.1 hypothetical protein BTK_21470 [Bacillus thuringiensis serovar kurstaki str. HD-1]AIM30283.1 hypothetical protein DF16_orf01868 [Bacillus thuringiensis serovar kurstaki str. YBT-1520]AJA21262.1 hypothetical protein BT4G